jgi:4-hydroxy-tetrahydrodipicolinate reductase
MSVTSFRLAVVGAEGRMGRRVVALAPEHGFSVVRALGRGTVSALSSGDVDVIVDFSSPEAFADLTGVVARTGTSLVSGTTGLGTEEQDALERASKTAAVLWEPNMSVGIHILVGLVERAASQLGPDFDVEVSEAHHRMKADAPSGTAKRLVEALLRQRGSDAAKVIFGREGRPGPRPPSEIAVHALRGGDVVGDHTVHFLGAGERIELTHRATHRDVFAHGALRAARFLVGKPPGRYGMRDLVADAP